MIRVIGPPGATCRARSPASAGVRVQAPRRPRWSGSSGARHVTACPGRAARFRSRTARVPVRAARTAGSGSARVAGHDVTAEAASVREKIGYVGQAGGV
ncbi:hypothetical protein ABZ260_49045, partial [Streptosporangium sp. NPDC006013]